MPAAPRSARLLTRSRRYLLPLAAAASLAGADPALAALDTAKIQSQVQQLVDQYVKMTDGVLQPQGQVEVVEDGDDVVITTPAMVVKGPHSRIDVPSSVVRLTETDADHVAFALTLPSRITGEKEGQVPDKLLVTIGGQQVEGIYRPSLLTFEKLDLRLDNIDGSVNAGAFKLGALRLNMSNTEDTPGKWRSAAGFALGDLAVLGPDKKPMVEVGKIENAWRLDDYDLPGFTAIQRRITGGNPFVRMPRPDDAEVKKAVQEMVQRLPELLEGASGGAVFRIAKLHVAAIQQPAFGLGSASFEIGLAPEEALYGLQVGLKVTEPEVDPMASPVPPHLLPRLASADTGLRRLPLGMIWEAVAGPLQQAMDLEMSGKMTPKAESDLNEQLQMIPMTAMGMAGQAGSFAEIKSIELEVGPARLHVHGVGPLMPGMPEPPLKVEATIEGLDELTAEVKKLEPGMSEQIMPVLVMLKGLGKATPKDGKVVHTYLVEQSKDGAIMVNGVNVNDLGPKPKQK